MDHHTSVKHFLPGFHTFNFQFGQRCIMHHAQLVTFTRGSEQKDTPKTLHVKYR